MWRGWFGNSLAQNPSKGQLHERTLKADRQRHLRIYEKCPPLAYRPLPDFLIGSPPIYRRSAFVTSGLLHYTHTRTGSVTAVLCANGGRFARQGKPPTAAPAGLCQRPNRRPGTLVWRSRWLPMTTTRSGKNRGELSSCARGYQPPNKCSGSRPPAESTTLLLSKQTPTDSRSPPAAFRPLPVGRATFTTPTSAAPGHHPRRRQVTPALVTRIMRRMTWVRTALRRSGPSQ